MKAIIQYISLLFVLTAQNTYAQISRYAALPNVCLPNGNFPNACVTGTTCAPAWDPNCTAGWVRSHGSPTMATYTENGQPKFYIYTWSQGTNLGEGVFTPYNFNANYIYTVRLKTSAYGAGGRVRIYAANGLAEPGTVNCGQPVPNITDKQQIGVIEINNGNANGEYVEFSYTNTSGGLYSQLWIFPESFGSGQYNLNIFSVEVCPVCESSITYNNGVVPTGTTTKGYIYAGSSAGTGGSGTVTVNGSATTEFIASKEVNLLPEFEASSTGGTFIAKLYICNGTVGTTRKETGINKADLPTTPPSNDIEEMKAGVRGQNGGLNLYPSMGTGLINITGDLLLLENVEIAVFDLSGKLIVQLPRKSYAGRATINLGNLNNGTYLLQIKQKNNTVIKKIIIYK